MNRTVLLGLVLVAGACVARAEESDEAMKLAVKLTTEGAATFDTKDAKAMTAYYTDDAQVTLYSKDKNTSEAKIESRKGKAEIEELYQGMFKNPGTIKSKNTVEYARMIDSTMLVIHGNFQPDSNDPLKVEFVQVRVKQGDKWLMSNLQLFVGPVTK